MKLSNITLIYLINGIGAIQEVELPVTASFTLSQDTEALMEAYKPYAAEYKKINAQYSGKDSEEYIRKLSELQHIVVEVEIKTLPEEYLECIVSSPVRMAMVNLNALRRYIFSEGSENE